jgi:transcriptional regulator with XRE-family HTH domain
MAKSPKVPNEQFASRVRTLRAQRAIAQSSLAKATGVSPAAIWQWEHAGAVPRSQTLFKLAQALGVSTGFLLTGDTNAAAAAEMVEPPVSRSNSINSYKLEDLIRAIEARGFHVRLESI